MKKRLLALAFALVIALTVFTACGAKQKTITYDFKNFDACKDDFMYVYSPICKAFGEFKQAEDGIVNFKNDEKIAQSAGDTEVPEYFPDNPDEFAYISIMTKEKYTAGTVVTLHCSFDKMGAPLIAFTDDINIEGEHNIYGLHFEVVAYDEGCNVWEIRPSKEEKEWPIDPTLIAEPKFEIKDGDPVEIIVEFGKGEITETVNGHTQTVKIENMPESFHVGLTACEGINHFYDFKIETGK